MEIGKHLTKGIWGLADKSLPVVYGIGYVLLVIRVLPEEEFGNFVLIQEIFLIVSGLATAFALQPLMKYSAEAESDDRSMVSASFLMNGGFILLVSVLLFVSGNALGQVLNSPSLSPLMVFVPAMLFASCIRNFTLALLQAKFKIQEVFWTDAVHFLGAPLLTWAASRMHMFSTALDLIIINLLSLSASSAVGWFLARRLWRGTWRPGIPAIQRVWDYGKYSLGGIVSSLGYSKADTFIVSIAGGPVQVALYNSAKVFVRVYETVSQVLQMFILPATSRLSSKGESASLKALVDKSILFSTIGMIPVFFFFLVLPSFWVGILYGGKYSEAVPLLQIFSLLSFVVPLMSVESNVLMGLGRVRQNFVIGMEMLGVALLGYGILIPRIGTAGAAIGYVLATGWAAGRLAVKTHPYVPLTLSGVVRRFGDAVMFVRSRLLR